MTPTGLGVLWGTQGTIGPPTLDGTATGSTVAASGPTALSGLTTTHSNDVVLLWIQQAIMSATLAAPTSTNLTFAQVGSTLTYAEPGFNTTLSLWKANASSILNSEVISVPMATAATYCSAIATAYSNASTTLGVTSSSHGISTTASAALTTTQAGSLVVAILGTFGAASETAGASQTIVQSVVPGSGLDAYVITQNAITSGAGTVVTNSTGAGTSIGYGMIIAEIAPG